MNAFVFDLDHLHINFSCHYEYLLFQCWKCSQSGFSSWSSAGFLVNLGLAVLDLLLMIIIMILIALGITLAMIACWLWLTSWVQLRQLYTCLRSLILAIPTICVHAAEAHRNLYQRYSCQTSSSWLNCALRGDEAVYWAIIGQQWLVLADTESIWGGTSWQLMWLGVYAFLYWNKVDIWTGKTVPQRTDWQTLKDMATQLLRSRSGALITQLDKISLQLL